MVTTGIATRHIVSALARLRRLFLAPDIDADAIRPVARRSCATRCEIPGPDSHRRQHSSIPRGTRPPRYEAGRDPYLRTGSGSPDRLSGRGQTQEWRNQLNSVNRSPSGTALYEH